jgi:hypothetical protein
VKQKIWILAVLTCALLAAVGIGCKKQAAAQGPRTLEDAVAELRAALATASPEARSNLYGGVVFGIRYGDYPRAMVAMDRIVKDPSLNDGQKKVANSVLELLKQEIQNAQSSPKTTQ